MKNSFSKFLKGARESKSLSLRDVEKITGISNSYLSLLEGKASRKPTVTIIKKLADAYNYPFHKLADLVTQDFAIEVKHLKHVSMESLNLNERLAIKAPHVKYILRCYLKLNEEGKKLASDYLGFLSTKYKRQETKEKKEAKK